VSNLLIVEGKSDLPFVETLTKHLNLSNNQRDKKNGRKEIHKIAILLDIDKNSLKQRIKFVNSQLKQLKSLL
jgi:hypothetical protein